MHDPEVVQQYDEFLDTLNVNDILYLKATKQINPSEYKEFWQRKKFEF